MDRPRQQRRHGLQVGVACDALGPTQPAGRNVEGMIRAGIVVVAVFLVVGPAAALPHPSRPIVFLSNWAPHFRTSELYVVRARGGRSRDLTDNELDDIDPSWSRDGKQVVFARRRHGSFDLYLMS